MDGWQQQAACGGMDPGLFFPERGESVEAAKAVCALCPVRQECLDFALVSRETHGIWGGLSERERRRLRRGMHVCDGCGARFAKQVMQERYCSDDCRQRSRRRSKAAYQARIA